MEHRRSPRLSRALLVSVVGILAACGPSIPEGRFRCSSSVDCPGGWSCNPSDGLCYSTAADLGTDAAADLGTSADLGLDGGIDECALNTDNCDVHATCTNTPTSFTCACDPGYQGPGTQCSLVDCGTLTAPMNGTVTPTGTTYGSSATYGCAMGYSIVGEAYRTCTAAGSWSGNAPTCQSRTCNLAGDVDTGTLSFTITHLGVPYMDGFDIDGLDNAAPPGGMGATVAGCGVADSPGGLDNALGAIAAALAGISDLNATLQQSLVTTAPDGGMSGSITVVVAIDHFGGGANDSCVGVSVTTTLDGGSPSVVSGSGTIIGNQLSAFLDGALMFRPRGDFPPSACTGGVCSPSTFDIMLRAPRLRLAFDSAHTHIQPGSLLAGYTHYYDANPAYAAINPTGLRQAFSNYVTNANALPGVFTTAEPYYAVGRDLHTEADGSLSACSGASTSSTNRNAVSIGFAIDSI